MTEEEKINIKEQFNYIVKNGIAPILKSAGFRKKGNNFHAHAGELDWCINIQKTGGDLIVISINGVLQSILV